MAHVFFNAIVLTVIIWMVLRKEKRPNTANLLALPLGLSVIPLLSGLLLGTIGFIGKFHLIVVFAISVFSLRWAFDMTLRQSLIVSGIWIVWLVLYPILLKLL